jgi:VWFA-related protein
MKLGLQLSLLGILGASAPAQETPPTFPSGLELVTVDAVVVDGKGQPVRGLTREDFVLKEDGRTVPIASFEAFDLQARPVDAAPQGPVATNQDARGSGRAFALILDDLQLTLAEAVRVRAAVASFVETSLRDGDEVVLGTTSGDIWWTARIPEDREDLKTLAARLQGRHPDPATSGDQMTQYEAYWINNQEIGGGRVTDRVIERWIRADLCVATSRGDDCQAMVRGRARGLDSERHAATRLTAEAVRRGIDALAGTRGRKSVLLFSRGFLHDSDTGMREVAAASREASAAVSFVDARGLVGLNPFQSAANPGIGSDMRAAGEMMYEEKTLATAGAEDLAADTGGLVIGNRNDLAAGAAQVANESSVYYLLGFKPAAGKPDSWRRLKVEVARKDATVRARRGYTVRVEAAKPAQAQTPAKRLSPAVARAIDSAHEESAIPLRMLAYVFEARPKDTARVLLAVELDASRFALKQQGSERVGHLEVHVVVRHRDSSRGSRYDGVLELEVQAGEARGWRPAVQEFELPSGVYQARVVVRDPASGALGSVSHRFEVPPAGSLRVSTPLLTDELTPTGRGRTPQLAMAAHRTFARGGRLFCQFEVYGAARAQGDAPRVTAGAELRAADGSVVMQNPPTAIVPTPDGRVLRTIVLDLATRPSGAYELLLGVDDEVRGSHVERRERFVIADAVALR